MALFLGGLAAGVALSRVLGWRGLVVLAAVGVAATTAGVDLTALWAHLGEYWTTLTGSLTL